MSCNQAVDCGNDANEWYVERFISHFICTMYIFHSSDDYYELLSF